MARSSAARGVPASMSPEVATGSGGLNPRTRPEATSSGVSSQSARRGTHASLTVPCGVSMGSLESGSLMCACASRSASASRMTPSASSSHMTAVLVDSPVSGPGQSGRHRRLAAPCDLSVPQRHLPPTRPLHEQTLRRWRVVSKARKGAPAANYRWSFGGTDRCIGVPRRSCPESRKPAEALTGKRAPRLVSGAPAYPGGGAVGSASRVAGRGQPAAQSPPYPAAASCPMRRKSSRGTGFAPIPELGAKEFHRRSRRIPQVFHRGLLHRRSDTNTG